MVCSCPIRQIISTCLDMVTSKTLACFSTELGRSGRRTFCKIFIFKLIKVFCGGLSLISELSLCYWFSCVCFIAIIYFEFLAKQYINIFQSIAQHRAAPDISHHKLLFSMHQFYTSIST